jgi:hypothetical protein
MSERPSSKAQINSVCSNCKGDGYIEISAYNIVKCGECAAVNPWNCSLYGVTCTVCGEDTSIYAEIKYRLIKKEYYCLNCLPDKNTLITKAIQIVPNLMTKAVKIENQ